MVDGSPYRRSNVVVAALLYTVTHTLKGHYKGHLRLSKTDFQFWFKVLEMNSIINHIKGVKME